MTTGNGANVNDWTPVVYRGDGAWIGVMSGGELGVGVEAAGRATLEGSNYQPMWPFMERGLSECLDTFSRAWPSLGGGKVATPEELIELTVETAWDSGREYWMQHSSAWVLQMAEMSAFDPERIRGVVARMLVSDGLAADLRTSLQSIVARSES
ncbi:hypothetical protein ACIA49_40925 [Kribbella sp. NPDC051587]|uniref:hypothetical protein n=1 Tax=Kribbella sp. NPDC051587 TaxID=3364119 RepID=UPI0037AF2E6A